MSYECGTVLGPGTVGLGEAAADAEQAIQDRAFKSFWTSWEKTREEWRRLDADRDAKVIESMSKNSRAKLLEASDARGGEIKRMIADRKRFEDMRKGELMAEAKQKKDVNRARNMALKKEREEGVSRRHDARQRELAQLHHDREELLMLAAVEKEQEEEVLHEHIDNLRRWHHECRDRAREQEVKRLQARKAEVSKLRKERKSRAAEQNSWRTAIVKSKGSLVHRIREEVDRALIESRVRHQTGLKKTYEEVKTEVKEQLEVKAQRENEWREERRHYVHDVREALEENRRAYEEQRLREKEVLQREARDQRARSRQAIELEEQERIQEYADYQANARALVERKRTESPKRKTHSASPKAHSADSPMTP